MNSEADAPGPVAGWARALAWVIVVASILAIIGAVVGLMRGAPRLPFPWFILVLLAVALVWTLPLFWIVAIRGRPPRHWWGLGSHLWQSKQARG
jgi:hypothetical protein